MSKQSPFDYISKHLSSTGGCDKPVPPEEFDNLAMLVRRCDEVGSLRNEYGTVELSPYMLNLLKISKAQMHAAPAAQLAAAGV